MNTKALGEDEPRWDEPAGGDDGLHDEIAEMFGELEDKSIERGGWPESARDDVAWQVHVDRAEDRAEDRIDKEEDRARRAILREQGKTKWGGKRGGAGRPPGSKDSYQRTRTK